MKKEEKLRTPHAVYRVWDLDGDLLYIGVSRQPVKRVPNHKQKGWGQLIARVELAWYETWSEAAKAEATAILAEKPLYNRTAWAPDRVGVTEPPLPKHRRDGRCPKCGGEKTR